MRVWELLAILVAWAAIISIRKRKSLQSPQSPIRQSPQSPQSDSDEIDYKELEQAEREVKNLDTDAKGRPLDDVIGDDWGPGTPKPPYT